ncbi:hypothetical protein BH23ACT5_BH23ACT5_12400 [soil metagenome]
MAPVSMGVVQKDRREGSGGQRMFVARGAVSGIRSTRSSAKASQVGSYPMPAGVATSQKGIPTALHRNAIRGAAR